MGLTNVSSFASGGAAGGGPISMTQVWIGAQSTAAIVYTVPAGKYFKGYIGHNSTVYVKVNGQQIHNYWNNAYVGSSSEANAANGEVILVAGSTVAAGYSNGNWLMVLGVEYDIPVSGTSSGVNL